MIRSLLKQNYGIEMSDREFNEVMEETENDIRKNHLNLGVKTNSEYLLKIASIYYGITKKCKL